METQATTPAAAQVSEPVSRTEQESSLHERMLSLVSGTPDNDPHAGTDLEEAPQEQTEAPKTEDVEPFEIDEETPLFDIKYKSDSGEKEEKLSLKQLREGYLAKQDYHRNIQKVKAEQAQIEQKVQTAQLQAVKQYSTQLETYKRAVLKAVAPEILNVDLNKLAQDDPAQAQAIFFKQLQVNQLLQGITAEQQKATQVAEGQEKQRKAEAITKARSFVQENIKGWTDELYQSLLKSGVEDYQMSVQDIDEVVVNKDPKWMQVLHDAYQYRSLQKAKPEIDKKLVAVPKVLKPGSADKPNPNSNAESEAQKRLRKSGNWRDAAERESVWCS
jgi:hypothetical protein